MKTQKTVKTKKKLVNKKRPTSAGKVAVKTPDKVQLSDDDKTVLRAIRQNKTKGLLRAEITEKTGIEEMDLTLVMRKLKGEGLITSKGATRATRWLPA